MLYISETLCDIIEAAAIYLDLTNELSVLTWPLSARFDPDILLGYEVQMRSWGYLLQRAAVLRVDLCQQLSRVPGRAGRHQSWC